MSPPGVRRQPSRLSSVAAGIGTVVAGSLVLALVCLGLAFVADLLLA